MSDQEPDNAEYLYDDPMVELYGKALEKLTQGKLGPARKDFEKVVAESDLREVVDRARQMLAVCDAREASGTNIEDPYLAAVYHKNKGEFDAALELCQQSKRSTKESGWAFLEASVLALQENDTDAVEALRRSAELDPKNRVHAYHDPDFAGLRRRVDLEEFFEV